MCEQHRWLLIDYYEDTGGGHSTYECMDCGIIRIQHTTPRFY